MNKEEREWFLYIADEMVTRMIAFGMALKLTEGEMKEIIQKNCDELCPK